MAGSKCEPRNTDGGGRKLSPVLRLRPSVPHSCHRVGASHLYRLDDCPNFSVLPVRRCGRVRPRFIAAGRFRLCSRSADAGHNFLERGASLRPNEVVAVPANGTVGALQPREATAAIRFCRKTRRWRGAAKSRFQCGSNGVHSWPCPPRSVRLSERGRSCKRHCDHRHPHGFAARPAELVGDASYSRAVGKPGGGPPDR